MTDIEKNNIQRLIRLLNKMHEIITSNANNDVSYGKKNIAKMIAYLKEELANDTMEYKELINIVVRPYKSMFPPRGGLSDFHIWDEDYQIRHKANQEYEQIKEKIEIILHVKNCRDTG